MIRLAKGCGQEWLCTSRFLITDAKNEVSELAPQAAMDLAFHVTPATVVFCLAWLGGELP